MKDEEKSASEVWWRQDRGDALGWAAVFIWGALVLVAEITNFAENFSWWDGWGVFFVGVGAILLVGTAVRLLVPDYWRPGLEWGWICGFVLLGVGLGDRAVWVWPLLLFAIAVVILYRAFTRRR